MTTLKDLLGHSKEHGEKIEPVHTFDCPHCGKPIAYEVASDAKEEHEIKAKMGVKEED